MEYSFLSSMKLLLLETNWLLGWGVWSYVYMLFNFCRDFYNCLNSSSAFGRLFGVMFYLFWDKSNLTVVYFDLESTGFILLPRNAFYLLLTIVIWLSVWVLPRKLWDTEDKPWLNRVYLLFASSSVSYLGLKIDFESLFGVKFSLFYGYFSSLISGMSFYKIPSFLFTETWFIWRIYAKKFYIDC